MDLAQLLIQAAAGIGDAVCRAVRRRLGSALRTIFDNPDNLYGFMRMPNDNAFFFGRSPLEVMGSGDMVAVYETFKRIDVLRGSQW